MIGTGKIYSRKSLDGRYSKGQCGLNEGAKGQYRRPGRGFSSEKPFLTIHLAIAFKSTTTMETRVLWTCLERLSKCIHPYPGSELDSSTNSGWMWLKQKHPGGVELQWRHENFLFVGAGISILFSACVSTYLKGSATRINSPNERCRGKVDHKVVFQLVLSN